MFNKNSHISFFSFPSFLMSFEIVVNDRKKILNIIKKINKNIIKLPVNQDIQDLLKTLKCFSSIVPICPLTPDVNHNVNKTTFSNYTFMDFVEMDSTK
jgi:hypothetical protein